MTEALGRYEILEEIGQGGFAIVYRARDMELDRLVALKELRPILLQDKGWVKRFRREARAIARLDHPCIVPIYDVGEVQERLFIVMRLVDGSSLEEFITRQGLLPWSRATEIITAIAEGLDYAHSQGILHRDLKPANILLDHARGPMLSDFGLAKLTGESSTSMTAEGGVVGTPHYIAPEVWEGEGTTQQSDIYALGCILYEMLTGEKVFKGETPPAVMMAHFRPLELPKMWPQGVPSGVANILGIALASKPTDRYATAGEMAKVMAALGGDSGPVSAEPPRTPQATVPDVVHEHRRPEAAALVSEIHDRRADGLDLAHPEQQDAEVGLEVGPKQVIERRQQDWRVTKSDPEQKMPIEQPQVNEGTPSSPTVVPTAPQAGPARWQGRRFGCLWIGVAAVVGMVLLVVVGVGGFCSAMGGILDRALATVEIGSTVTEDIHIPPPDSSNSPSLEINFGSGELFLAPGAGEMLVEGTASYNVTQLRPEVLVNDNAVRLSAETGIGFAGLTTDGIENRWDLKLSSAPMELTVEAGGAKGDIELGGLSLVDLTVSHGAANFGLSFSEPNQVEMDTLRFTAGASNATLNGLANARAKNIIFEGGAGHYTLDFSGELQDDVEVKIGAGLGTVRVIIPEDMAAEVSVAGGLSNVTAGGAWQEESNDEYILPGEGYRITIRAEIGAGNLELLTP